MLAVVKSQGQAGVNTMTEIEAYMPHPAVRVKEAAKATGSVGGCRIILSNGCSDLSLDEYADLKFDLGA